MDLSFDLSTGQKVGYIFKAVVIAVFARSIYLFYDYVSNFEYIVANLTLENFKMLAFLNFVVIVGFLLIVMFVYAIDAGTLLQETIDMKEEGELK